MQANKIDSHNRLKVLFQPGANLVMVASHHQLQSSRFEEQKNNPDAAGNLEFKSVVAQPTQTKPGVGVRLSKSFDKLSKALIDFLQFQIAAMSGPTLPTCPQFNDEGF